MIKFIKDIVYILSGRWERDSEIWDGPVTLERLERQREYIRKIKI